MRSSGKVIKGSIERGENTWQPINVRGHQIVRESNSLDIGIIHNLKVDRWAKCLELKLSKRSSRMKVVNSEMEPIFGFKGCRQPDWRSKLHHQLYTASLGLRVFVGGNTIYSWILFQMDFDFLKGQAFTRIGDGELQRTSIYSTMMVMKESRRKDDSFHDNAIGVGRP